MSLTVDGFWKSGFWTTTFWADGFWFEGTPTPTPTPTPAPAPSVGGKSKRRERYAAKIDGELRFFDSIEEIEGYLASLREEKIEVAEKRAEKVYAGSAVRVGSVPKPPKIVVSRSSEEVTQAVSRANEMLAAQYMQILLKLKEQDDDEDDLLLL